MADVGPEWPVLHNPLLNALFSNPAHATGPTKHTIRQLADNHTSYTILVPPAHVLFSRTDPTRRPLADLCYGDDEFVRSHIIKSATPFSVTTAPVSKAQLIIYDTMNGRQVLLRGGTLVAGKNFKKRVRAKVLAVSHLESFCKYMPQGSRFHLIYIEDTLLYGQPPGPGTAGAEMRFRGPETARGTVPVTFEDLLRNFPVLSKAMSARFCALFHHNNRKLEKLRVRQIMRLSEIIAEFRSIESDAVAIVQDCVNENTADGDRVWSVLESVARQHPGLDMDVLVHEYVELNLYDKVWQQLVYQYDTSGHAEFRRVLTPDLYHDLSCLSFNQLDVPVDEPWKLNLLQGRITESIDLMCKLQTGDALNLRQKMQIIADTVIALTGGADPSLSAELVIDADTLIGLLIMVVVHAKIQDLEAHLVHIRHFSPVAQGSLGYMSYILSNVDAVLYLLSPGDDTSEKAHLASMVAASAHNYKLWYAIRTGDDASLVQILEEVRVKHGDRPLPKTHFLRSKNIHSESCFNFAVRSRSLRVFNTLLEYTAPWVLFEDLVFDRNTTTGQNLLMVALQEECHDIAMELIGVIEENATADECSAYYNSRDKNGRTVGHYLSHNLDALDAIGQHIDWCAKDKSAQTPLVAVCRCYDHSDYRTLVQKVFRQVFRQCDAKLTLDDHIDKAGNTLLHVLAKGIRQSGLLSCDRALVDPNALNAKQLSPMALYVRYSRTESLAEVLQHDTTVFDLEDPRLFYNVLDYCSFSASKLSTGSNGDFLAIQDLLVRRFFAGLYPGHGIRYYGLLTARLDSTLDDWLVQVVCYDVAAKNVRTKYVAMDKLHQFYHYQKSRVALDFLPPSKALSENFPKGKTVVPISAKFHVNRSLEYLNAFMCSAHFMARDIQRQLHQSFSRFLADIQPEFLGKPPAGAEKEVTLTQACVSVIVYFVEFSQNDIRGYLSAVRKVRRLLSAGGLKQQEQQYLFDYFLRSVCEVPSCHVSEVDPKRIADVFLRVEPMMLWLEMCAEELLRSCATLLDKVVRWKASYGRIRELNNELQHFELQIVGGAGPKSGSDVRAPGLPRTNSLSVELALAEIDIPDETSFFNFGLVDSKRSRYKKILMLKAEGVKRLMDLNDEIRRDHERLAASISQFLPFRAGYLVFCVKRLVQATLLQLRVRRSQLHRYLAEARAAPLHMCPATRAAPAPPPLPPPPPHSI
ncbi:hypothetical protein METBISCDRAFT_23820 [Metschnikowia bicuspidata]|uniref:VPS9 domain-containing protein n=1 Tax=Metschnikowia bicuspidata TaxID=27322 RepID=A0A4P9ZAS6_9ASCO|nr:hypothetical protein METBISCDRAFT_23820 [Metschnikowia bicuspidata]